MPAMNRDGTCCAGKEERGARTRHRHAGDLKVISSSRATLPLSLLLASSCRSRVVSLRSSVASRTVPSSEFLLTRLAFEGDPVPRCVTHVFGDMIQVCLSRPKNIRQQSMR